ICACGASMGDKYGPMVVAREEVSLAELNDATIAIPGTLTTAYLALRMCMGVDFKYVVVPFDEILNVVEAGSFEGAEVHAGLIIHEGQLTYASQDLKLVVDLGVWWDEETGLPLPLGCNGIRKDMGEETMLEVTALLKESIVHGLENRAPALDYALGYGRGLDRSMADEFVGMYVNDWTVDFGEKGREAVRLLLKRGFECGVIPELIEPEFVG
ncbi:MAG: ABC transporter substrate-binding protein, partial [Planctomycetaceae bacterium]|nr:ABC transporter substrate-binding protein [Planctomycetaceae bacterium]